ncbi:hypothetical protein ACLOAV_003689 [Pseudogymnoascus australis]
MEVGKTVIKGVESVSALATETAAAGTSGLAIYGAGVAGAAVIISAANAVTGRQGYGESKKSRETSQAALKTAQESAATAKENVALSREVFAYTKTKDQAETGGKPNSSGKGNGAAAPPSTDHPIPVSGDMFPSLAGSPKLPRLDPKEKYMKKIGLRL